MRDSKIAWTHHTFNPWIGCSRVSAGCVHCYAETLNNRWGKANWGPQAERAKTSAAYWKQPLAWAREAYKTGKKARVFCASMADVGEDRPELIPWRAELAALITATGQNLDWLLLTKRPENLQRLFRPYWGNSAWPWEVWAGTSVEDQNAADKRIPELIKVPAKVRFLSVEPMIGPIDLSSPNIKYEEWNIGESFNGPDDMEGIHWVIVGGESGPGFRPMEIAWAQNIRAQCGEAHVAFFMKQLGGHPDKRHTMSEFPKDLQIQEWPK